jgi:peptidoglycan/xylan/chitin deacetylase (PgdA/CDA1 family)
MTATRHGLHTLRRAARHLALNGLAAWDNVMTQATALSSNRIHFLLLHHTHVHEVRAFRRLLDTLHDTYRFISYSEAVVRILANRIDDCYMAVSFDDGLKCCLKAAETLEQFGARACFFVCPSIVGETDATVIQEFCATRLRCPPAEFLNWNDIEELVARGHEIGGHTMQHVNLSSVGIAAAEEEIGATHHTLSARRGVATHFAWPYGRFEDFSRTAAHAVFAAGFRSCASGVRGCHGAATSGGIVSPTKLERLCLRRESIVADWPQSHTRYFLSKSARRPLAIDDTWPSPLNPVSFSTASVPCTSPSMPFQSNRAAA